ncbi:MAG: pilin [bacterium]|nr:pilin [bacterium]
MRYQRSLVTGGVAVVAVLAVALPLIALAQATQPVTLPNPIQISDPRVLIGRVISAVLGLVGSIALVIFMWGGFQWMTSAGNAEKVTKGKMAILWAALGLAVIFSSYALVRYALDALKPGQQATPPQGGQQASPP